MPVDLHWFKWEAASTWISGFLLLGVLYYMGGSVLLVDPSKGLDVGTVRMIGLGSLVVGWVLYDLVWMSPLGKAPQVATAACVGLLVALAFGLNETLAGRAAYLHVGAVIGTVMAANVWMRIIPSQRARRPENVTSRSRSPFQVSSTSGGRRRMQRAGWLP